MFYTLIKKTTVIWLLYDCYMTGIWLVYDSVIWLLYDWYMTLLYDCYMTGIWLLYDWYMTLLYDCYMTGIWLLDGCNMTDVIIHKFCNESIQCSTLKLEKSLNTHCHVLFDYIIRCKVTIHYINSAIQITSQKQNRKKRKKVGKSLGKWPVCISLTILCLLYGCRMTSWTILYWLYWHSANCNNKL